MEDIKDIANPATIFKSWVQLYSDNMYSWAFYKTRSKETAEDLVQDSFLAAFQSFAAFEGKSNPKTWLFAILNNKISDDYRKNFRNRTVTEQRQSEHAAYTLFYTLLAKN